MANDNIYSALMAVQGALKVPKSQRNEFGKYNYRSCEDILEAVKPLCVKHGLLLTLTDEAVLVGSRYYIKATALVTDGKDRVFVSAMAREEENRKGMDASQITGTASSYARKYALNGLFCIDDTKDADTMEAPEKETARDILLKVSERAKADGIRPEQMTAFIKQTFNKTSGELTVDEARQLLASFDKWEEKA